MSTIYYVSKNGSDFNSGAEDQPFKTIQRAADMAVAGNTVVVHEGIYREWVKPRNGGFYQDDRETDIKLTTECDGVYLEITLPEEMFKLQDKVITSKDLGMTRITECRFEGRDGNDLVLDKDLLGNTMGESVIAGALQNLKAGKNKIRVWNI